MRIARRTEEGEERDIAVTSALRAVTIAGMCGLTGFIDFSRASTREDLEARVRRMSRTLVHRGPDDEGHFVDEAAGMALGFRRLSIVDLSPAGHQPMTSDCGRFVLALNGEIYNFEAMRKELEAVGEAPAWRGHSDTEVLLAWISRRGVDAAIRAAAGMFALAIWDRRERVLTLVRDRLGKKPLYWGFSKSHLLFGSELKALLAHPAFSSEIDRGALALYLRHAAVPAPYSIWSGFRKLVPGTSVSIRADAPGERPRESPYWSLGDAVEAGRRNPFEGSPKETLEAVEKMLREAVAVRMVADVPLGAFLSGGIDSSLVVALMQAQSERPVRTFTMGFAEAPYDEAAHARAVAGHLGTDHTELTVTPEEARAVIPKLPALYDEPFADSSQIPTYLVSALARRSVTVSLSGDGGDEVFGGYNRYAWASRIWRGSGWIPAGTRRALASALGHVSVDSWSRWAERARPFAPKRLMPTLPGDKMQKLLELLPARDPAALYLLLVSLWKEPSAVVKDGKEHPTILSENSGWPRGLGFTHLMMYLDHLTYLPDDILVKVDRASMGVSLESRAPFLDHRLVELAWRLPLSANVKGGEGKILLRKILAKYVPPALFERPKMGFGVPIDSWLRGPLKDWAEELLDERRLAREGFFEPRPIRARWEEHRSGRRNWSPQIWCVLMFESWLEAASSGPQIPRSP